MTQRTPVDEMGVERAAGQIRAALTHLGVNLSSPDLAETPWRTARLWADLLAGHTENPPALGTLAGGETPAGLVALHDLPFHALCGHHLLPFFGRAHVAYWPSERVAGLGDLARVVEYFAKRLTFQERLAVDVARHLERELSPRGVGVLLEGRHLCLEMRGAERRGRFETAHYRGVLEDPAVREEFLAGVRGRSKKPAAAPTSRKKASRKPTRRRPSR